MIGTIPIRNLWLLMLYASDLYRQCGAEFVGIENNPEDLPDLVAELLSKALEQRLHRNLTFGYQERQNELTRVRGRIDILKTERHQLISKGKIACRYEELSVDTVRNRYVLTALERITGLLQNTERIKKCRALTSTLKLLGVTNIRPTRNQLSTDKIGRNDKADLMMVAAAKLVHEMAIPNEEVGSNLLPSPDKDEAWLRKLFEKAVGGFYSINLTKTNWKVETGKALKWQIDAKTSGIDSILPSMKTDIIIENLQDRRRIVIDTKFNSILVGGWYRQDSIRSSYLYQMYAYLSSQIRVNNNETESKFAGILLHPAINSSIDETAVIQGLPIRFSTVDLSCSPQNISQRLIELMEFPTISKNH